MSPQAMTLDFRSLPAITTRADFTYSITPDTFCRLGEFRENRPLQADPPCLFQDHDLGSGRSRERVGDWYFDLAASVFEQAKTASAQKYYASGDLASAINGLGNIQYNRGDVDRAVESYKLAVTLEPDYAYAWHDLFSAYIEQAKRGKPDLPGMREAYENWPISAAPASGESIRRPITASLTLSPSSG
jgi:tetratricopeptide (TPR) repeat protein